MSQCEQIYSDIASPYSEQISPYSPLCLTAFILLLEDENAMLLEDGNKILL